MTGGCCDKCDLLQTKVLLTSIPFNSLPTPTYTPLHPCSKPCCNSSLVTLFKTVWYFFSPLLQNENVFPSLHFSLVRIYRNRKDWDLANTGDARPEKWACSLKLLHRQGFVDWSVIMMQNTWLVLSQMRSFFSLLDWNSVVLPIVFDILLSFLEIFLVLLWVHPWLQTKCPSDWLFDTEWGILGPLLNSIMPYLIRSTQFQWTLKISFISCNHQTTGR